MILFGAMMDLFDIHIQTTSIPDSVSTILKSKSAAAALTLVGRLYEAALHIGIQPRLDPNGGQNTGVFNQPFAIDATTWTRSSARRNHYDPAVSRSNYHFLSDTTVARVIFDGTRAVGVEYLPSRGGDVSTAFAAKEVLVAAGALHTPQVLQLSGVGPRDLLEALNIPIISDLPGVGSNLQDQTTFPFVYTCQ